MFAMKEDKNWCMMVIGPDEDWSGYGYIFGGASTVNLYLVFITVYDRDYVVANPSARVWTVTIPEQTTVKTRDAAGEWG